jgi:hypothetical protein
VDGVEVDVRSLRKALNLDPSQAEEGEGPGAVNKRAIVETLCAKSPARLVAARLGHSLLSMLFSPLTLLRELYERLFDANFLQTLQSSLESDPTLSLIVTALVSHNRQEIMGRADYEDGTPEALGLSLSFLFTLEISSELVEEIESHLNNPTQENLQDMAMIFLTHSLDQVRVVGVMCVVSHCRR